MPELIELRGAENLRLVAEAYGPAAGQPALLLHGLGQTRQSWGLAANRLGEQGWRAYALDHRGHGDSERSPSGAYQHADVARDVLALCAVLDRPPLIIGASLGGVAALFAQGLAQRQLFCGVVLVDITPEIDIDGARRIIAFMADYPDGYSSLEEAAQAIAAYRSGRGAPSPQGLARVLRHGDDGRWRWHWDPRILDIRRAMLTDPAAAHTYRERMRSGMHAGVARLDVPTMLVRGGSSDIVTPEAAAAFVKMIPHARFIDVADATHMVAGDRNDLFTAAVLDFALPLLDLATS